MISDHIRTRFLGGGDLYARATYTRVYTVPGGEMYWVRNAHGQTDEGDETSINPHVLYPHGRVAGAVFRDTRRIW